MTTATSVFVSEPGDRDVLQVREHDVPAPGAGEVQVEVAAAGVNFIDVYKRQGIYPGPTPFVLGEEGAGTVVAVGPEVSGVAVGDRVAWCQSAGSMSTLTNKPADKVVPVPAGVDLDVAAAAMLQGLTAHYLVTSTYAVREGDVALVHAAAGGVGQLLVQLITARGATVVATAGTDEKLDIAKALGASHLINYSSFSSSEDLAAAVRSAAGRGVDVAYDGVGKATFDASLASLRPRGMMVLFGGASGQVPPVRPATAQRRRVALRHAADPGPLRRRPRRVRVAVPGGARRASPTARSRSTSGAATPSPTRPRPTRRSRVVRPRASSSWCRSHDPPPAAPRAHLDGRCRRPWTDALLVEDGRITAVGAAAREAQADDVVDLPGALVMPGLHDAHIHTEWVARSLSSVDLREARSLDETLELVRVHAESLADGEWLHSGRWNHNIWDVPVQPDRHSLDTVSGDRVAALSSVDGHTIWANSLALRRAGITRDTPDPVGGEIVRDADGEPTGILRESAQDLLDVIEQDQAPLRPWLERAQELLLSVGLTSITDIDGEETRAAYADLHADHALRLRVTKCTRDGDLELAISEGRRSGQGDDRFRVGPVKFFSDGALGSHTAHMTEPFIGHEGCGIAAMPYDVLLERTLLAVRSGLDVCTHAIGDEANRLVLDSFEAVRADGHDNVLRVEHAQHVRLVDIPRFRSPRRHRVDAAEPLHGRPRARRPDHRSSPTGVVCVAQLPRRRGAAGLRVRCARRGPESLLRPARSRHAAARRRVAARRVAA